MNPLKQYQPIFVDYIPEKIESGKVYVAINYEAVVHLCACGCGSEVSTPLSPKDWNLKYDGKSISLSPSIGNWQQPCRSHYFIRKNRIVWAEQSIEVKASRQIFTQATNVAQDTWPTRIMKWFGFR